jgi:putative phosphonate metabolism protein
MRIALYWAPELDDPLHAAGSAWLGRDAETGAALAQPTIAGHDIAALTADPRGYGLHATLKPPFRPTAAYEAVRKAAVQFAARVAPFQLPPLSVQDLDGFLALRENAPCSPLHALADAAVEALDAYRTPPDEAELARRRRSGLSPRQDAHLLKWGYPHVFEDWRFHVTLTRRLKPEEREGVTEAALRHFEGVAGVPRRVASVCLFTQAAPGAPFLIAERLPLGG